MNKIRFGHTKPGQDPVYMPASEGPFDCAHCEYFAQPNKCSKPEMEKVQDKSPAIVQPMGCCNYFEKR